PALRFNAHSAWFNIYIGDIVPSLPQLHHSGKRSTTQSPSLSAHTNVRSANPPNLTIDKTKYLDTIVHPAPKPWPMPAARSPPAVCTKLCPTHGGHSSSTAATKENKTTPFVKTKASSVVSVATPYLTTLNDRNRYTHPKYT
ncbi:unnamed protein product, partial [Ectocarpus sp. 8 AP-2014]